MNYLKQINKEDGDKPEDGTDNKKDKAVENPADLEVTDDVIEDSKETPADLIAQKSKSVRTDSIQSKYFSPQIGGFYGHKNLPPLLGNSKNTKQTEGCYIIGICGGPSCGKTTVTTSLIKSSLEGNITSIKCSDFYKPLLGGAKPEDNIKTPFSEELKEVLKIEDEKEREIETAKIVDKINKVYDFDSPDAIEYGLLIDGLTKLKNNEAFHMPKYNKKTKTRSEKMIKVKPCDVVVIEGHLIFANKELRDVFDLKIYIDADDDVRLSRRILKAMKDTEQDGSKFDIFAFLEKYEKYVKPAYEKYVEPTKKYADIVIPNYGFTIEEINVEEHFYSDKPALELIMKEIRNRAVKQE